MSEWINSYDLYKEYIKKYNKVYISADQVYKNEKLGHWVLSQRTYFKNNKLNYNQIKLLEDIIDWKWDSKEQKWNYYYNLTKKYILKSKHSYFKTNENIIIENQNISSWINFQRKLYLGNELEEYNSLLSKAQENHLSRQEYLSLVDIHYSSFVNLFYKDKYFSKIELEAIEDVGKLLGYDIKYINKKIDEVKSGNIIISQKIFPNNLKERQICFTGTSKRNYKNKVISKKDAENIIKENNMIWNKSLLTGKKLTDVLVISDIKNYGNKV